LHKDEAGAKEDPPALRKEDIMKRAPSAYEAVVAIAKEARRLNAVPGVYLEQDEKPIPRAVKNFVDGKVEYEIEGGAGDRKSSKKGRK
jgi:DNA-directed RNA polymerase subunit K/omega